MRTTVKTPLLQRSLKTRVTLFTLSIFVLSLWTLAYFTDRMLRQDMERLLGEQQFSTASMVADEINEELRDRMTALEMLARRIDEKLMSRTTALQAILDDRMVIRQSFNGGYFVTDADGTAIASIPLAANRVGINWMFRNHVATALKQGKPAISTVTIGKALKVPVFGLAVPIRNSQGRVIGSLVGVINLTAANFLDRIMHPYARTGGYVIVSRPQRLIVTATDKRRIKEPAPAPGVIRAIDRFLDGHEGTAVFVNPRGTEVFQSVKGIPLAGWYVGVQLPVAEALAPIRDMQQRMLVATVLLTLLTGWLTWWMLRRQLAPLQTAADTLSARSVAGQSPEPLPNTTQDEIGHLIGGFNQLLETLREREAALRESEAYLSTIVETEPECVRVLAPDGSLLQMNRAGLDMIEAESIDQVRGYPVSTIVSPEHRAAYVALNARVHQGESGALEFEIVGLRGGRRWLETHAVPLRDSRGAITGLLGVTRDITEKKVAMAELEQHRNHLEKLVDERTQALSLAKDAAEAASRAKSTFLANMSHELRTPMNAIMGMTGMALRRTDDPKLREQLGKIDRASQHLLQVINDILDISKIEAERLTLEQHDFVLSEVLDNLSNLVAHDASGKALALHIDLSPELARTPLLGDSLRLGQILLNYTANAVKFTQRGSITVRLRSVEDTTDSLLLRCEVIDTGIGISADDLQRLFTAFEQADGSMTRKYGGTGLGLAISKRLARLMGGDAGVESEPGAGSTFWFTARLGKATTAAASVPPAPPASTRSADERLLDEYAGTRILLAEDEPITQEVSHGLLEDAGLAVDIAEDGRQAWALARQNRYALILMDMQMPILNGVDATRAIRADSLNKTTPILAMTANAYDEDRQACLDAGMDDHIAKPVDPVRLYETLLKWLEQPRH